MDLNLIFKFWRALLFIMAAVPTTWCAGPAYYFTPLQCTITSFYDVSSINELRATYTERDDIDCCYEATTRNSCCMEASTDPTSNLYRACKCHSSVTCGLPTTTTEATASTTTTTKTTTEAVKTTTAVITRTTTPEPLISLCGQEVNNECVYKGLGKVIYFSDILEEGTHANLVYVTADVDGLGKEAKTFITDTYIAEDLKDYLEEPSENYRFEVQIDGNGYPLSSDLFKVKIVNNLGVLTPLERYADTIIPDDLCESTVCKYQADTMEQLVDLTNCTMVSYESATSNELKKIAMKRKEEECELDITSRFDSDTDLCFTSISGDPAFCTGDAGSPMYCFSPSNQEDILFGVVDFQNNCGAYADVYVRPIPTDF